MQSEDLRAQARGRIEEYLRMEKGIDTPRKPFRCLNTGHEDAHPSMSLDKYRHRVKCFSCGATYDIFDLVAMDYSLTVAKAFEKTYAILGLTQGVGPSPIGKNEKAGQASGAGSFSHPQKGDAVGVGHRAQLALYSKETAVVANQFANQALPFEGKRDVAALAPHERAGAAHTVAPSAGQTEPGATRVNSTASGTSQPETNETGTNSATATPDAARMATIAQAQARIDQTDYPQLRGLGADTVQRFGLGFDPDYRIGTGWQPWKALIVPTGAGCYMARNTDPGAAKKDRIRKSGANRVFNQDALWQADAPVFVVEGEFDALSILEVGGVAVSLGSTANVHQLLKLVDEAKPTVPFLLALDEDDAGRRCAAELLSALQERGLAARIVHLSPGYKDPNEALCADRGSFAAAVHDATHSFEQKAAEEARRARAEYRKTCVADALEAFREGVRASVDTPSISTGFSALDDALGGGLFEGLYIIGAITSLGKTSFVLQMADQMAIKGQDVLIFSLEMARSELIAKSLSRLTFTLSADRKAGPYGPKTTRGITCGKFYAVYSEKEKEIIQLAYDAYACYAEQIFVHEGVGDIGVAQIRDVVARHVRITGKRPVVIVDYLQILAPESDRGSDKQNTDKAVLELKRLSRDFKVPVIGISSFNRQSYNGTVKMEAFKESGAIEYSSDVLLGMQLKGAGGMEFDAEAQKGKDPREIEVRVLKNRNGAVGGEVGFSYYAKYNCFLEGRM